MAISLCLCVMVIILRDGSYRVVHRRANAGLLLSILQYTISNYTHYTNTPTLFLYFYNNITITDTPTHIIAILQSARIACFTMMTMELPSFLDGRAQKHQELISTHCRYVDVVCCILYVVCCILYIVCDMFVWSVIEIEL